MEALTGKCKEDFFKWMALQDKVIFLDETCVMVSSVVDIHEEYYFEQLPYPFKQGVYQCFFDSHHIYFSPYKTPKGYTFHVYDVNKSNKNYNTIQEAIDGAFKQANEIYNTNK